MADSRRPATARFPPTVTVALLKDAAARAAFVRSEIAALKASQESPSTTPALSPKTANFSWTSNMSPLFAQGNSVQSSTRSTFRESHHTSAMYEYQTLPQTSPREDRSFGEHGDQSVMKEPEQGSPQEIEQPGSNNDATKDRIIQRMRHVNRAMDINAQKKTRPSKPRKYQSGPAKKEPRAVPPSQHEQSAYGTMSARARQSPPQQQRYTDGKMSARTQKSQPQSQRSAHGIVSARTQQTQPQQQRSSQGTISARTQHSTDRRKSSVGSYSLQHKTATHASKLHSRQRDNSPGSVVQSHVSLSTLLQEDTGSRSLASASKQQKPSHGVQHKTQSSARSSKPIGQRRDTSPVGQSHVSVTCLLKEDTGRRTSTSGPASQQQKPRLFSGNRRGHTARQGKQPQMSRDHASSARAGSRPRSNSPEGQVGPWDTDLDESVSVLLASVDRKIARDYMNLAAVHNGRHMSRPVTKTATSAEKSPQNDTSAERNLNSTAPHSPWSGQLIANEEAMPPAADPFYTTDPDLLARQLCPDGVKSPRLPSRLSLPGSALQGGRCDSHHGETRRSVSFADSQTGNGDSNSNDGRGQSCGPGGRCGPSLGVPTHASPALYTMDSCTGDGARTANMSPISTVLGDSAASLSMLSVADIIQEVATGTHMMKWKNANLLATCEEPLVAKPSDRSQLKLSQKLSRSLSWGRKRLSIQPSSGSRRRMQLVLDADRAILAYRRGVLRGTNHGYIVSTHCCMGTWNPNWGLLIATDACTFRLCPTQARDYWVWVLGVNVALHFTSGNVLDATAAAVDISRHYGLTASVPGIDPV